MCVKGEQVLNCITDSRLPGSYRLPVLYRPPLYIHFTGNTAEPVNLIFRPKDLPLPIQWPSHSFQLFRLSYLLFHHCHSTSIERKGSLFRCGNTVIEDKAQALVANKSWGRGIKFLTTSWMQCLYIQKVVWILSWCLCTSWRTL